MAKTNAERQRERREKGLCCSCSSQALPGRTRCQECTDKAKARYQGTYQRKRTTKDESRTALDKQKYEDRKARGVCVACEAPRSSEAIYCDGCLQKQRQRQQARAEKQQAVREAAAAETRAAFLQAGSCQDCGDTIFRDNRCRLCWSRWRARECGDSHHAARKAAGLCQRCNNVADATETACQVCQEKRKQFGTERLAAKRCRDCGLPNPEPGKSRCPGCRNKKKQLYQNRQAAGLCTSCGLKPAENKSECLDCLEESRRHDKVKRQRLRTAVLAAYGGCCACCGEDIPEFLHVDHIHNDGAAHRKSLGIRNSVKFYVWLRRRGFPKDRFQLLCANCNLAKSHYGICPHQRQRQTQQT